ncbi:MAG: bifunctional transaldolase/phosoglucose isomerase [Alkalispirochaeta sp.]
MTKAQELHTIEHSVWIDYMRRQFVEGGGLQTMIQNGVRGVTSNPTIFEKAIAGSSDYDADMQKLVAAGTSTSEIYEKLAIKDIQGAADLLYPVYKESGRVDGYVSLEVSPDLAHETEKTITEARRLHGAIDRPNVMIKVPGTHEGIPAIETLIGEGISINVTLLFSVEQYELVAEAYLRGLERFSAEGGDLSTVASVASLFISRVEGKVDAALEEAGMADLKGRAAVANAKLAYARFQQLFSGERWNTLQSAGAQLQRPLWASTGIKDPAYPDTKYVDELIGPHTVNTMPPDTFDAFMDHGTPARTLDSGVEDARIFIEHLPDHGIDLGSITQDLQDEAVEKFADSFASLMKSVEENRQQIQQPTRRVELFLGTFTDTVTAALEEVRDNQVMERIWRHDYTVWNDTPDEITNRLGWLHSPERMQEPEIIDRLTTLAADVRAQGYTQIVLLGMGGSSLAPEVFAKTFENTGDYLDLAVLDSTDPAAVLGFDRRFNPAKTLYIVATKSGGTAETLSFFKHFYNRVVETVGTAEAGNHFIAITDSGSALEEIARQFKFRASFANDAEIGGRYSALSYFGLVPAAFVGVDLKTLLDRAAVARVNCDRYNCPLGGDNNGGRLGVVMGEMAKAGRDKLTLIVSPSVEPFGDWVEQLIAESTGKDGTGILPVVNEPPAAPSVYGKDRLFIHVRLAGDSSNDEAIGALIEAGHPVVRIHMEDVYDVGLQFFLWEMATAVAGHRLGINPFDQPNVESAKNLARSMIETYEKNGTLPELEELVPADRAAAVINSHLHKAADSTYVALQAYVTPLPEVSQALHVLRQALRAKFTTATTCGFGPRFLHSTGQLHKGDGGHGVFIQFTATTDEDLPIPDEAGSDASTMSFATLKQAQMLGDRQALESVGRRVVTVDLAGDPAGNLRALAAEIGGAHKSL